MSALQERNAMERLALAAEKKKMEVVLPMYEEGKKKTLRVEIRTPADKKVADFEEVVGREKPENAAERLLARLNLGKK